MKNQFTMAITRVMLLSLVTVATLAFASAVTLDPDLGDEQLSPDNHFRIYYTNNCTDHPLKCVTDATATTLGGDLAHIRTTYTDPGGDFQFNDPTRGTTMPVLIHPCGALGMAWTDGWIELAPGIFGDPLTSRKTPLHEVLHQVQWTYGWGWSGFVLEGTARMMQDKVYDDLDQSWGTEMGAYFDEANWFLDTSTDNTLIDQSYSAGLFWTYFTEQYGAVTTEPQVGVDAARVVFEHYGGGSDDIQRINSALDDLSTGTTFQDVFMDFIVANYAKDLTGTSVTARYQYIDDDRQPGAYNRPALTLDRDMAAGDVFSATDELRAWSAKYYEARPGADVPIISVEFHQPDASAVTLVYNLLVIKDDDLVMDVCEFDVMGRDFVRSIVNRDYDQVVVVVGALDHPAAFRYTASTGGGIPTLNILWPQTGDRAQVDADDLNTFHVHLEVVGPGGVVLSGLEPDDFDVTVDGTDFGVITGHEVMGQYWLVVQPEDLGVGIYDLEVSLSAGTLSDTEVNAVNFSDMVNADTVIVVDRSGSMLEPDWNSPYWEEPDPTDKIYGAIDAAKLYVNSFRGGDKIGLVWFSDDADTSKTLRNFNEANRADFIREIDTFDEDESGAWGATSIGDGLWNAQDELDGRGAADHDWAIILLSDGKENRDRWIADVVCDGCKIDYCDWDDCDPDKVKTTIHTVALGSDADREKLEDIADKTGGRFEYAIEPHSGDLPNDLADIYRLFAESILLEQRIAAIRGTYSMEPPHPIHTINMESGATEATFVVNYNWKGELYGGKPVVTLLDPDGDSVKPTYVEDTHQLFRIALPKSGAWTVKLEQPVGVEFCCEGQYLIEVSVKSKATLEVFLGIPLEECVIGTYLPVVAFLTDTQPITGATISMEITTPELEHAVAVLPPEVNTLSLYDDGEHGDSKADDGVYVGTFRNTDRAGVYRMKVKAEGYSSLVGSFERETKLAFNMRGDEDSDGDGLPDRWERNHGLDPHDGTGDQGAEGDPDRDGLTNKREYDVGTYPMDPDTDDGGENDGSEVVNGRDPHNPGDDTLRPPTSLRAIPGVNSVNLTIGYLHEHTFLIVSRAKSPDGPWESFRIYPTGGYEDGDLENDVTYYYRVVGANLQMHTTHVIYRVSAPTRIVSATPKADPIPPSGYVVINNGAELTETEDVTLMIWADPDTTEIMIANDPELADAEWEPYETAKNWTLLPGTGLRTVYVLFRDAAGNIGPRSPYDPSVDIHPAMDSIVLREIATTERRIYFSTEEDFVTQGPKPQDGNPIISDGDLLCSDGTIIARNRELLKAFETEFDLGLDASGVIAIDAKEPLVAFSTELNDPKWHFTAGDLLTTTGAVIPNIALLAMFDIPEIDLGLDAVHFTGDDVGVIKFLEYIADQDADVWREEPEMLSKVLEEFDIDIWFSTEGTAPKPGDPLFLDGDLLSARYGTIVARNSELLPASVPAGIPDRGVDFGLDAATTDRTGNVELIKFSTEILYEGRFDFTDGDILRINNGVVFTNRDLIVGFEPKTGFLGLDAISIPFREGKPDLVMGEISLEDVDGHCRLSYQVSNAGTASAQASTTYLYLDGEKVAEDSTNSLAAGASAWDEFSYQITGEHTFEVCADGINEIEEISEANNCRTVELACQQPILAGNIIYHESHGAGIWRMNPDGSGNAQLSDHGWFAEYSPDNTKIVFGEYYHDGIWMMDADGTNQKQLTKSGSAPTWSPDGKKIAYHGGDTAGASRSIWVIAADGTNAHQLSDNPGSFPKWSPDAKRIAYHGEVNSGIWLINPGGTDETLLHRSGGYPAWSPDGKRIAYASLTDWCIWTIAANGTGATKLTDIKGVQPTWSPDGTKVAYEDLANNEGLRVVNSDGADDHLINKVGHAPDWSEGSSVLPAKPNLAYIYSTDAASAESYKSLLDVNEYPTTLIPMSDVADTDFSEYGAIIVGSDTSFGYEWGDSASVGTIKNSEKRIIGLGFGGSGLFQELGLSINWGHGWIGQEDSIYVVDPSHTIFNSPNPIVVPADGIVSLYSSSGHIGEYAPSLSADVVLLGREPGDADHYPIVQEEQNILWGFTASPDDMTQVGQDIFINVVDHMTSSTEFDIYFADADESPGSVYHYDIASGMEETVYTRPSKRLYSFAFHPKIPEKLYYVNANEYKIYRTHQISSGWAPEEVVYTHTTYIRDIAFAFDSNGELGLYFSEATGAGGDGKIYRIEDGYATPYYDVKLADVDRSWAGDFAFDAESNLYLSSGNRVPARIYRVDDGSVKEIYKDEKEPIKGLVCEDGVLYYANWRTKIYRLDTDTGERTVVYSNPERGWLSDVGFR